LPFVLRRIRRARWYEDAAWLPIGNTKADALSDLSTEGNKLSVWVIEDDLSNLHFVLAGLAAERELLSNLDYALVEYRSIEQSGMDLEQEEADTPVRAANGYHRDMFHLSAENIAQLVSLIKGNPDRRVRVQWQDVGRLLDHALSLGIVDRNKMKPELLDELQSKRDRWI